MIAIAGIGISPPLPEDMPGNPSGASLGASAVPIASPTIEPMMFDVDTVRSSEFGS